MLLKANFVRGQYNPCLYWRAQDNVKALVHGDDLVNLALRSMPSSHSAPRTRPETPGIGGTGWLAMLAPYFKIDLRFMGGERSPCQCHQRIVHTCGSPHLLHAASKCICCYELSTHQPHQPTLVLGRKVRALHLDAKGRRRIARTGGPRGRGSCFCRIVYSSRKTTFPASSYIPS